MQCDGGLFLFTATGMYKLDIVPGCVDGLWPMALHGAVLHRVAVVLGHCYWASLRKHVLSAAADIMGRLVSGGVTR